MGARDVARPKEAAGSVSRGALEEMPAGILIHFHLRRSTGYVDCLWRFLTSNHGLGLPDESVRFGPQTMYTKAKDASIVLL